MKRPIFNRLNMFLLGVIAGCIGCAAVFNGALLNYQQRIIGDLSNLTMVAGK